MPALEPRVRTCLWLENDIETAVGFYVSLLPGSEVSLTQRAKDMVKIDVAALERAARA